MAESVDAGDSKSPGLRALRVRVSSRVLSSQLDAARIAARLLVVVDLPAFIGTVAPCLPDDVKADLSIQPADLAPCSFSHLAGHLMTFDLERFSPG